MLNTSINEWYLPQKKIFRRIVSVCFSCAGVYWLFIYGLGWGGALDTSDVSALRGGQTLVYFILLTLWGVEYLRESRRLSTVIKQANVLECPPHMVDASHLSASLAQFGIITGVQGALKSWIMPALNLAGLAVASALIVLQYVRLLQAVM